MKHTRMTALPAAAVLLIFTLLLSGCSGREAPASGYYESDVLSRLTEEETEAEKIPGMAEELCVIRDESIFDASLIDTGAAGLFCEDTKELIYAKNATERMYPASLTKLMTALLVLESELSLSDEIRVGEEVTGFTDASSLAGLKQGYSYSVEELLIALLVPSGNDAANALAAAVSGSVEAFTEEMNARARELGMLNTHFTSPGGLHDSRHYTTVYDLYLLTRACLNEPEFLKLASLSEESISGTAPDLSEEVLFFKSTNSYLRNYTVPPEGLTVRASKTGYTASAGRCLMLVVTDAEGRRYISIILKADTYDALYIQMNALLSMAVQGE